MLDHPWIVLLVVVVFFAALAPLALHYTASVNYAGGTANLSGTESARAQALLATVAPAHSTLIVVVALAGLSAGTAQNDTLGLQAAVTAAALPFVNGTESVYSAYSAYLDGIFGAQVPSTRALAGTVENTTASIYRFPAAFLAVWSAYGATPASINSSYAEANGSATGYEAAFRSALLQNASSGPSAAAEVQAAVDATARPYFPATPARNVSLASTDVTAYTTATDRLVSQLLNATSPRAAVPVAWVAAALAPGDFGTNYVSANGLAGLPALLRAEYVSPDGSVGLVLVVFSVSDSFRTSDGTYPAQSATPTVRTIAAHWFGDAAVVTGSGAFAYDSAQLTDSSGPLFALTFLFLGLAVALTLRSWIAPLLTVALVSLATVAGYLAVELTALLLGRVDFTVTYTLTAVTLGVATDYSLFLFYRYREELTRGTPPEEALRIATRSSGFAILVSAVTVAVGLGSLSFLSGLRTWGPVLAVTILAVGILSVTLLPALMRLVGHRLFVARWLRPAGPPERSVFYRAAARSGKRPGLLLLVAVLIAVPAVLGFLFVPTTYNFSGGLPSGTPSAQGQQEIQNAFGANLLYPTYVIVSSPAPYVAPNGSLTASAIALLPTVAVDLLHRNGVESVTGPFVDGRNLSAPGPGSAAAVAPFLLDGGRAAYFVVYSSYSPYSPSALSLVASLRANPTYLVGGLTSSVLDQQAQDRVQFPLLEVLLAALIAVVLGFSFRSVLIPLVSLSGVFLSISATTGLLYLISTYLLHTALLWLIPLILFVILMSLGNDYTVFLLSRIREEQRGHGEIEGIRRGIAGSGVVVSALGLILAFSLGSLALQPISFLQEVGIAFVISLVLDTFVVRPFYFPAMLTLIHRHRSRRSARRPGAPGSGGTARQAGR